MKKLMKKKITNIDVMHFVEDQNGKVQDVVNMTEQGQANVETTTDGEIQKAEFNTESFSSIYNHMEKKKRKYRRI